MVPEVKNYSLNLTSSPKYNKIVHRYWGGGVTATRLSTSIQFNSIYFAFIWSLGVVTHRIWNLSIRLQISYTIVEEWKTNLMSLAILFHFLCAQHVSDINISIIRSLRLCCWFTTSVILFCKDGWFSVSLNLRCTVVCVWCDVLCRFVVVGRHILIDIDRHLLCFVITVFVLCVVFFIGCLVISALLMYFVVWIWDLKHVKHIRSEIK